MRLLIAWGALFHRNYFVVWLKSSQMEDVVHNSQIKGDIDISYIHMHDIHLRQSIKIIAAKINDVDLICDKAEFEAKVLQDIEG
jgi:uncharacterized protein (DUF608 family)